jgi:ketosteroid isomerase-like protein
MSNTQALLAYLRHYEAKDIEAIAAMLADEVQLRDWKICVRGKTAALAETRANFAAAERLQIEVLKLHEGADSVSAELRILVDGKVELFVVDVLDFDADGRIRAIRAYLGRGDGD